MPPLSELPGPPDDPSGNEPPEIRVPPPGPMSRAAALRLEKVECPAFSARRKVQKGLAGLDATPIVLASGRGSNLFDVDGNRYVDLAAGFGSLLLGHGAPPVTRAMEGQADRLVQALGDVYSADVKLGLLERLAALVGGESPRVLLTSSGGDAVTAALKTAMLATGKPGVVAFGGAYHGMGYAPLAALGLRPSYREPFAAQLSPHVRFAPYPGRADALARSLAEVEKACAGGDVGAILVEPILGRGGCVVPPDGFLRGLAEIAKREGALLVADEIWTGLGRAGAPLRTAEVGVQPDVVCLGKGLGGGLPIAACIASEPVMRAWASGDVLHTSTHAGSPLACAAAIATLDALRFKQLPARAKEVGARFKALLEAAVEGASGVVAVRGEGLMVGVELESGALSTRIASDLLAAGYLVLTGGARGEVLTLTPALTIDEPRLEDFARALGAVLEGAGGSADPDATATEQP